LIRTIIADGEVAGNVLSFRRDGRREVGYWLGRDYWGKGIATHALSAFVSEDRERPLYAKVAGDNTASIRVLEKCGFTRLAAYKVDDVRDEEFQELLMILE
jgi:RimJ/RimL family protein N-acetyltransferase